MTKIAYSKAALKSLARIPAETTALIQKKIAQYAVDPTSLSAMVKRLKGSRYLRLRVGDFRVIFNVEKGVMLILDVGDRKDVYD